MEVKELGHLVLYVRNLENRCWFDESTTETGPLGPLRRPALVP